MKTNYVVSVIVLIVVLLIGAFFYTLYKNRSDNNLDVSPPPLSSPTEGFNTTSPTPSAKSTVTTPVTQPASGESEAQINAVGISIFEPKNQGAITFPFKVAGYGNMLESETVTLKLTDASGLVIFQTNTACKGESICEFSVLFDITKPQDSYGILEASSGSFSTSIKVNFN